MPFAGTRQLPDENIIITTYEGDINAEVVRNGSAEVAKLMATIEGRVYAVVDLSTITTSFGEVLKMLAEQAKGQEGTTTDPKLAAMVLVGSDNMVRMYADAMRKRAEGVMIPMYPSVEAGVAAMRALIEQHSGGVKEA